VRLLSRCLSKSEIVRGTTDTQVTLFETGITQTWQAKT
jgi:hypothetical protein